jgi:hypothetical protein
MKELIENKLKEVQHLLLSDNLLEYEFILGQEAILIELLRDIEDYNINSLYTLD